MWMIRVDHLLWKGARARGFRIVKRRSVLTWAHQVDPKAHLAICIENIKTSRNYHLKYCGTNQQDGDGHCMENANAAVDELELKVLVQVEDDPWHDPEDVEDVQHRDGDEDGREEAAEFAVLPVLDDDDEEEKVEDEGEEGEDGPPCPPPVTFRLNHLQRESRYKRFPD